MFSASFTLMCSTALLVSSYPAEMDLPAHTNVKHSLIHYRHAAETTRDTKTKNEAAFAYLQKKICVFT